MTRLRTALAAIALLAASLGGGAALAQGPENAQLGRQAAHELFATMNAADLIREGALKNNAGIEAFARIRPEWKALMLEAMDEAVARDLPAMEALLGRSMAKTMTADELNAGLVVFRDPQARAAFAAMAHHQTPPGDPSKPCAADCMRAMASPAGRGFMTKIQTAFDKDVQSEMIALLLPDVFILFGEKAKAAEAKRAQP